MPETLIILFITAMSSCAAEGLSPCAQHRLWEHYIMHLAHAAGKDEHPSGP